MVLVVDVAVDVAAAVAVAVAAAAAAAVAVAVAVALALAVAATAAATADAAAAVAAAVGLTVNVRKCVVVIPQVNLSTSWLRFGIVDRYPYFQNYENESLMRILYFLGCFMSGLWCCMHCLGYICLRNFLIKNSCGRYNRSPTARCNSLASNEYSRRTYSTIEMFSPSSWNVSVGKVSFTCSNVTWLRRRI